MHEQPGLNGFYTYLSYGFYTGFYTHLNLVAPPQMEYNILGKNITLYIGSDRK